MAALIDLLALLAVHWRLGLSVLCALAAAVVLATLLSWFTGAFSLALVIGSVGPGLLWEVATQTRVEAHPQSKKMGPRNG